MQEDVYRSDGLNLYAYCRNNPVIYYDPSGYYTLLNPQTEAEKVAAVIADTHKDNGRAPTYAVANVADVNGNEEIRISSSNDNKNKLDKMTAKALRDNGYDSSTYKYVGGDSPTLKNTKTKDTTNNNIFVATDKSGNTIDASYTKYNERTNPTGKSKHHAEQRMLSSIKNGETLTELVPTRPCCKQCQKALVNNKITDNSTALDKVPNDLRNAKNARDAKKKYQEDQTSKNNEKHT